jgi:transcriptional regulator with XRE-family HTH domain
MESFGKRLLKLRKERGLTQQQLGDVVGVGKVTISRYERHGREADYETLLKLAKYFDVSIDYMLGRISTPRPWAEPPRHILVDDLDDERASKAEDYVRLLRLEYQNTIAKKDTGS